MKISEIQIGSIYLPLRRPFKTALRTVDAVHDIVVRVFTEDGAVGYGEAPATPVITGDTVGSIRCAIRDYIRPALVGMDLMDLPAVLEKLNGCLVHNTTPKAAVDMALYDLWGKSQGRPLYQLLGGAKRSLRTDLTISLNCVEQMVADSLIAVKAGYDTLKIKVGNEPAKDVARVASVRTAVGPDVKIRVDANQGWDVSQAIACIRSMEDRELDIELVEQPVPYWDRKGLQQVASSVQTPILADESVFSLQDAEEIIERRLADCINIKLMKTGGIWNALKICQLAERNEVQCMVGCMMESRLSVAAAAHLAAGQKCVTMVDLDGPSLCAEDPFTGGPIFDGPAITMTGDPGVGVRNIPCEDWRS